MAPCAEVLERFNSRQYADTLLLLVQFLTSIAILFPVAMHSILAAFIVYVNQHINSDFNLPSSIVSIDVSRN
jgi:hypothetical protein